MTGHVNSGASLLWGAAERADITTLVRPLWRLTRG